jgi:hypothetical protein
MEFKVPLRALGYPQSARVTFVNFWTNVGGDWRSVDMMLP